MSEPPTEKSVSCPECNEQAIAVVPENTVIVESEEKADGKVRVNCYECDDHFMAYFAKRE